MYFKKSKPVNLFPRIFNLLRFEHSVIEEGSVPMNNINSKRDRKKEL